MTTFESILDIASQEVKIYVYVKILGSDGVLSSDWTRIDNYKNKNRILNFGTITQVLAETNLLLEQLKSNSVSIKLFNDDGAFSEEENLYSLFYNNFFHGSLLKIEAYHVINGVDVGGIIFEGIIDDFESEIGGDSTITASDYLSLLNKDIDSLKYDAENNPSGIFHEAEEFQFETFFNQLINYTNIRNYIDVDIWDGEVADVMPRYPINFIGYEFSGTVLDVINEILKNSQILIKYDVSELTLYIYVRLLPSNGHTIYGDGNKRPSQIMKINKLKHNYDKVISQCVDKHNKYKVLSSVVQRKFNEKIINTKNFTFEGDESLRVDIVENFVRALEVNKKTIEFEITFVGNSIQIYDTLTIHHKSVFVSQNGTLSYYNIDKYNSGAVYSSLVYGVNLGADVSFYVYKIVHDLNSYKTKLFAKEL